MSEEIMDITGLKGGVKLWKAHLRIEKMQFKGKLRDEKEAEKYFEGR